MNTLAGLSLLLCLASGPASGGPQVKEERPGLIAQAKVTPEEARQIALKRVPGIVQSQELEVEHGRLVYSFDMKVPHHSGVEELLIDAKTGKVISEKHESPKAEQRERQGEGQ